MLLQFIDVCGHSLMHSYLKIGQSVSCWTDGFILWYRWVCRLSVCKVSRSSGCKTSPNHYPSTTVEWKQLNCLEVVYKPFLDSLEASIASLRGLIPQAFVFLVCMHPVTVDGLRWHLIPAILNLVNRHSCYWKSSLWLASEWVLKTGQPAMTDSWKLSLQNAFMCQKMSQCHWLLMFTIALRSLLTFPLLASH